MSLKCIIGLHLVKNFEYFIMDVIIFEIMAEMSSVFHVKCV